MKLLKVDTLEAALDKLEAAMKSGAIGGAGITKTEWVTVLKALGRIAAEDVLCDEDIPGFDRSTMDGYAVVSKDTQGAGETMPVFLDLVGEVERSDLAVCLLDTDGVVAFHDVGDVV